jgi:regulator of sigma E protease
MESILSTIFYYVLIPLAVLGIAVNIHEFGHFMIAKLFGMRVEAYSFFGLGPRIWGFKKGHTDYRISAIPLGAYVKLYGDEATAALEGGESQGEPVPERELYELRPRWQKFLVMLGGPFMNLVLAFAIPLGSAFIQGIPAVPAPIVGSVKPDGPAAVAGIKTGDRIVAFNGVENPTWRDITIQAGINPERAIPVVVERSNEKVDLQVTPRKEEIFAGQSGGLIDAEPDWGIVPVVVGQVSPNSGAADAGLQSGDRIVSMNGIIPRDPQDATDLIQKFKDAPIALIIERGGQRLNISATVRKLDNGESRLGFIPRRPVLPLEPATVTSAFAYAYDSNIENLKTTATVLGQVFAGKRSVKDSGIGGPVGIFQQSAEATKTMGVEGFFLILGLISLSLGIFNLLPIPLLDGGQILVLAIEKVMSWFGKTLSLVAKERIQLTGLAIVLLLMVTVIFFDVSRLVGR